MKKIIIGSILAAGLFTAGVGAEASTNWFKEEIDQAINSYRAEAQQSVGEARSRIEAGLVVELEGFKEQKLKESKDKIDSAVEDRVLELSTEYDSSDAKAQIEQYVDQKTDELVEEIRSY